MKRLLLLTTLLVTFVMAQSRTTLDVIAGTTGTHTELLSAESGASTLHFTLGDVELTEVMTNQGMASVVSMAEGAPIMVKGAPAVPLRAVSLIIPNRSAMKVNVLDAQYKEYTNILVAPSKGNLTRDIDPATIPYEFGKHYTNDAFYPGELALLRDPYILRDYRGQTVLIQPVQYNPVTRTLRVYYDITIEVIENGVSTINVLDGPEQPVKVAAQFNEIYKRHFVNYGSGSRYTPVEEEGNMLVICYPDFMDSIQPYIDWKIKTGMSVELVDVSTIGASAAIKTYIADYYNTKGLTYVLLVGDSQQVPSSSVGGNDSDNNYTYVAGGDHYPDLFCGRFSAETEQHVITQVQRVLDYEIDPIADTSWYRKAIGIASDQGPGDDGEYDYQHIRKIGNEKLIPYTYNYAYELFDGSQGGNDAGGNPTQAMVATAVNSGATIINYTGHGSDNAWSSSNFSSTNVNQLTNGGRLPFIFSVACVNGNFVNSSCFAEAWMRAEDNGEPAGAIATLMSTINQSWNPPMAGQDEMDDILTEAYANNIKRTFAGISMNGCMLMNDEYGSDGNEMTDTWTVFGDPSLLVRTDIPQNMSVSHPTELHIGESSMTLTCNAEGAKAALTSNGVILGTAFVSGGSATITFDALTQLETLDFVVTAYNYRPYITTIEVIPEMGPFVTIASKVIDDVAGGNGDGLMDYAEDILLNIELTNVGVEDGYGVYSFLSSTSPYVTITADSAWLGDIALGDTLALDQAFGFAVANHVPDMTLVMFTLTSYDVDGTEWTSNFMLPAHAPKLTFSSFSIDDASGNNNGKLDPGETVNLNLTLVNNGSSEAYEVVSNISTPGVYVNVNSDPQLHGNMPEGVPSTVTFSVTADGTTPAGYSAVFSIEALGLHDVSLNDDFYTIVGQIPVLIVNFANDASADSLLACLNNLQVGGEETGAMSESLEIYTSVFVLLGTYPDNHVLTSDEGDQLAAYLLAGGRVYMEGGDTWAYDPITAAHELFFIKGLDDGSGDLGTIVGDEGNFMKDFSFTFNGTNNYIDKIAPYDGAMILLSNVSPAYTTAVSFENEVYKTVGSSAEFAGMAGNDGASKDGYLAEILNFFGVTFTWTGMEEELAAAGTVTTYPNPLSDHVNVAFDLNEATQVSLQVTDITGREVYRSEQSVLNAGHHVLNWNAGDAQQGVYLYRLTIGGQSVSGKLLKTR